MDNEVMDITQELRDTENALRDFIAVVLHNKLGDQWVENCGVSDERLKQWKERQAVEKKRQKSGIVEGRLLYYADIYDLRTILKKHWSGEFSDALGEWKTMEVWLKELEKLRDPDAHRRELLPHQKHLIAGISGEIRTRLVRYRSKQETSEDYYPRIESVRDSLGNVFSYGESGSINTEMRLRVGDVIEYIVTATDPMGESLEYSIWSEYPHKWQDSNILNLRLTEKHVGKRVLVLVAVKSQRKYHAKRDFDDVVIFNYEVLPPRSGGG